MGYVIAFDIGTTGVKTCLFEIDTKIKLIAASHASYQLYMTEHGGVEQHEEEWWEAMCQTCKQVLLDSKVPAEAIRGISFCSQMQALVLVDENGNPVRRPMSYLDQRAVSEFEQGMKGLFKIAGVNAYKLVRSLMITRAASTSVKDPVWKYKWVESHEPELFKRVYKWLDVKDYLINQCTGNFYMTKDSAFATLLYDTRKGKEGFSDTLCNLFGVKMSHLPDVINSTDIAGYLTRKAANELGLVTRIPVFGGGGDAALIGIGAGAVNPGETHIYSGTSGWISTVVTKQKVDVFRMIASIVGAKDGLFHYFAEMETAGKCLEWVRDHLALDEIGIYLSQNHISENQESILSNLYSYLMNTIQKTEIGSKGVIFTPWLHGNRCPFEDPMAAGMFFNIHLETGKTEMLRAVLEGVCFHLRWMLEGQKKKIDVSNTIRFVGGGALSPLTGQMLADITGHPIEIVENPQNVGALGAAAIIGIGLHEIQDFSKMKEYIPVQYYFEPVKENALKYQMNYEIFIQLYKTNHKLFQKLNQNR